MYTFKNLNNFTYVQFQLTFGVSFVQRFISNIDGTHFKSKFMNTDCEIVFVKFYWCAKFKVHN